MIKLPLVVIVLALEMVVGLGIGLAGRAHAAKIELNLSPSNGQILKEQWLVYRGIEIIPVSVGAQTPASNLKLSPVVRIESHSEDFAESQNARWGTGVIIGRFHDGPSGYLRGRTGFLVLTANHVLLDGTSEESQRLTFFTQERRAWRTQPFQIYSTSVSEDLALLVVEASAEEMMAVDLPKLGLLDPEEFRDFTWVPNYTRVNPGLIDQKDLSYSEISPLLKASMVTHDAVNSLAPDTEDFWYIGGEFVPGMSGGPVFTNNVQARMNVDRSDLNGLLVGVMGYIFDRQSRYGYAYPLTERSLKRLLRGSGDASVVATLPKVQVRMNSPSLYFPLKSDNLSFGINKKKAPDSSVADELILRIWLGANEELSDRPSPVHIEFQQIKEFPTLSKEKLLELLKGSTRFLSRGSSSSGSPGGGGVDGSPGGGGIDGSPGSGPAKETSPNPESIKVASFETLHSIAMSVIFSNGQKRIYFVEKVLAQGEEKPSEFLKDLYNLIKLGEPLEIITRAKSLDSRRVMEKGGRLNLNVIKKDVKLLKNLAGR